MFCDMVEGRAVEGLFQCGHSEFNGYDMYVVVNDLSKRWALVHAELQVL